MPGGTVSGPAQSRCSYRRATNGIYLWRPESRVLNTLFPARYPIVMM